MKKFFVFIILASSSLISAKVITITHSTIIQTIHNTFGPNIKITYRNYQIEQNIDLENKSGNINLNIPSKKAAVSPSLFSGIVKGKQTLDVDNYPFIVFKSTKINFDENNISSVEGHLTVKRKTVPIVLKRKTYKCVNHMGNKVCTGEFIAKLDRRKLDLNYGLNIGLSKQAPIYFSFTHQLKE